jgi:hypothetical protein
MTFFAENSVNRIFLRSNNFIFDNFIINDENQLKLTLHGDEVK